MRWETKKQLRERIDGMRMAHRAAERRNAETIADLQARLANKAGHIDPLSTFVITISDNHGPDTGDLPWRWDLRNMHRREVQIAGGLAASFSGCKTAALGHIESRLQPGKVREREIRGGYIAATPEHLGGGFEYVTFDGEDWVVTDTDETLTTLLARHPEATLR